jgi:hypothetical protein
MGSIRRTTKPSSKHASEMALICKAACQTDLGQCQLRVAQQHLGPLHSKVEEPAVARDPDDLPEGAGKMPN